jgi:hypothetical protein
MTSFDTHDLSREQQSLVALEPFSAKLKTEKPRAHETVRIGMHKNSLWRESQM